MTLNLAAAAQKLEAMVREEPDEDEDMAATPPATADVAPGDMGTPWTKEVPSFHHVKYLHGLSAHAHDMTSPSHLPSGYSSAGALAAI